MSGENFQLKVKFFVMSGRPADHVPPKKGGLKDMCFDFFIHIHFGSDVTVMLCRTNSYK